jgi:oligopeptide/dipeptide ABC transporter ATP-binding protein
MSEELLRIENLVVEYRTEEGVVKAVDDVSLTINKGEVLGLVGESGCGKSTLALSIMGLLAQPIGEIVSGHIYLNDIDLVGLKQSELRKVRGKNISMIFQDPTSSLNPVFTVGDQLIEAFKTHDSSISSEEGETKAIDMLRKVGISDPETRINQYPHEFSGGMKQRAMIAIGMANNPQLLIADEPTTNLDVTIQAQILELMRDLMTEFESSILIITHNLGVVAELSDRVAVMYAGKIVEVGTADEIFHDPQHPYTKGLISSLPGFKTRSDRLPIIPGRVPNLVNPPTGCRFHPRCTYASDRCATEPCKGKIIEGRFITCHSAIKTLEEAAGVQFE